MTKPLAKRQPPPLKLLVTGESLRIEPERFEDIADELPPLFVRYGDELGKDATDPDWSNLLRLAMTGVLRVVTLRDNNKLVGFAISMVGPHLMYRSVCHGITIAVFIDKPYRHGWTGLKFLAKNRDILREWGVKRACIAEDATADKSLRKVYERVGYTPDETTYAMRL
jgi:GNAT superfamily N-acetyltransferase